MDVSNLDPQPRRSTMLAGALPWLTRSLFTGCAWVSSTVHVNTLAHLDRMHYHLPFQIAQKMDSWLQHSHCMVAKITPGADAPEAEIENIQGMKCEVMQGTTLSWLGLTHSWEGPHLQYAAHFLRQLCHNLSCVGCCLRVIQWLHCLYAHACQTSGQQAKARCFMKGPR
jgi:hypothetical protein